MDALTTMRVSYLVIASICLSLTLLVPNENACAQTPPQTPPQTQPLRQYLEDEGVVSWRSSWSGNATRIEVRKDGSFTIHTQGRVITGAARDVAGKIARADLWDDAMTVVIEGQGPRGSRTFTFATTGTFRIVDDAGVRVRSDAPFTGRGRRWTSKSTREDGSVNIAIDAGSDAKVATDGLELAVEAARTSRIDMRLLVRSRAWTPNSGVGGHSGGNITATINPIDPINPIAPNAPGTPNASNAPLGPSSGVRPIEYRDLTYSVVNGRPLQVDVYQHPDATRAKSANGANGAKRTPVFVFIHGGGWSHGERPASYGGFRPALAMGASIVTVEYRLANEAPAPAAVQDVRCALAWVRANADKYHFDPARIIPIGTSAGGHLALMSAMPPPGAPDVDRESCAGAATAATAGTAATAVAATAAAAAGGVAVVSAAPPVAAIVDFYGITDFAAWSTTSASPKRWLGDGHGDAAALAALADHMSPITYVRPGLPPTFIVHGDADRTVPYDQSVRLNDALTKAGVDTKFITIPGGVHGNFTPSQVEMIWTALREFLTQHRLIAPERHAMLSPRATPDSR